MSKLWACILPHAPLLPSCAPNSSWQLLCLWQIVSLLSKDVNVIVCLKNKIRNSDQSIVSNSHFQAINVLPQKWKWQSKLKHSNGGGSTWAQSPFTVAKPDFGYSTAPRPENIKIRFSVFSDMRLLFQFYYILCICLESKGILWLCNIVPMCAIIHGFGTWEVLGKTNFQVLNAERVLKHSLKLWHWSDLWPTVSCTVRIKDAYL